MIVSKFFRQAKAFFLRNKVSQFEYDCVRQEIYSTNKNILTVCSFVATALFLLLTLLSAFIDDRDVFESHAVYGIFFLLLLAIHISARLLPQRVNKFSILLMYLFYLVMLSFTIVDGVFDRSDNYAVTFFVFEFGFPLIFVDKIKRSFGINFAAMLIFCICTILAKESYIFKVDIFYAIVFISLSFLPTLYLVKIRIREFSLRQLIESERDTDELTGLLNKTAFIREAKKSIANTRNGILIILDLDYFKEINDTYGHFTGDNVLKLVSTCIQQTFRSSDIMGRFGGDEFVVLMSKTENVEMANVRCNQLLESLNSTRIFPNDPSNSVVIQSSIGFALFNGQNDFDALFKNADSALYEAKKSGKNCVKEFV